MNRGGCQSSPVQQMMAGNPNWWSINSMRPPSTQASMNISPFFHPPSPLPPNFLIPQFAPNNNNNNNNNTSPPSSTISSSGLAIPSWHIENNNQELPESWSQLLLGGLVGEDEKGVIMRQFHQAAKKLENWEEQILNSTQPPNTPAVDVKQENSRSSGGFMYGHHHHGNDHIQDFNPSAAALSSLSQIMQSTTPSAASSPMSSCVTSFSNNNMLDFSSKSDVRHPPPHRSSDQCNNGGALKRARVQPSSTPTTFKVRKEKLGDRITALHQLVSPFGKTDTASVLLEAIGYIRFLQSQIEALSLPYLGSGSGNMRQQPQSAVHGERNCMFPEDPGQLLNDNCMKRKGASEQDPHEEPKKDLRSRGLCLVPVSCTLQVGSDNGADYWAPALSGGGFQ